MESASDESINVTPNKSRKVRSVGVDAVDGELPAFAKILAVGDEARNEIEREKLALERSRFEADTAARDLERGDRLKE